LVFYFIPVVGDPQLQQPIAVADVQQHQQQQQQQNFGAYYQQQQQQQQQSGQ
jgi:hypothetical protein